MDMSAAAAAISLLISLVWIGSLNAHPQCLDGKPPFASSPQLQFCTEYENLGCCTALLDRQIQTRYEEVTRTVSSQTCKAYMKSILCQQCSPYAAHLYSYEETGVVSPLPGLCLNYCTWVYNTCGADNLALLDGNRGYRTALQSHSTFCGYTRLADQDYCYPSLKTNAVLNERYVSVRQNTDAESCMCLQTVASGHSLITFIESNPIDDNLMYVGEQKGLVYVYEGGVKRRRPFLDLSTDVLLSTFIGDERGLLGLVFHPAFSTNRQFFVYYVLNTEQGQAVRISQWVARNRYTARKGSERLLLDIPQPYFNHNGGQLLFGNDGYLYIFTGDGGSAGDPLNNGQNLQTLLGKALRIDVNGRRRGTYGIPPDNPFIDRGRGEIYAYGLRNAWRCSKDRGDPMTGAGSGRIFCGDVGQNKFEEIDIIVNGGNYGWGTREGFQCFSSRRRPNSCGQIGPEELPIYAYDHSFGKSITGGYVYRGCEYPDLNGAYIYGDFTSGRLFKLEERQQQWFNSEINMCSPTTCSGNWVSSYGKGITSFGTNGQGDILMASTDDNSAHSDGSSIYKLIMQPFRRSDPSLCFPDNVSSQSTMDHPQSAGFSKDSTKFRTSRKQPIRTPSTRKPSTSKQATRQPSTQKPATKNQTTRQPSGGGFPRSTRRKPTFTLESTTTPVDRSEDDIYYNLLTDTISRRQRHLADLIAQYEALLTEMAAAGNESAETDPITTSTQNPQTARTYSWQRSTARTPRRSIASMTSTTTLVNITSKMSYSWRKTPATTTPNATVTATKAILPRRQPYYWEKKITASITSTTTVTPASKRTYSWQRVTYRPTSASSRKTYSWQTLTSPQPMTAEGSKVFVRRHKVTTPRPGYKLPNTTRRLHSWETTATIKRDLYSWETTPTTKRKLYAWEVTPATKRKLYAWEMSSATKRKLYTRGTTPIKKPYLWQWTTPTSRRQIYSWQTTTAPSINSRLSQTRRKLYSWETTTTASSIRYRRTTVKTTSAPVGFATNYALPDYLKAEENHERSYGGSRVSPTIYRAPERTYISNNIYSEFGRDDEEWRASPYYFWLYK